jgi:predicted metal-dependent hydrolase
LRFKDARFRSERMSARSLADLARTNRGVRQLAALLLLRQQNCLLIAKPKEVTQQQGNNF